MEFFVNQAVKNLEINLIFLIKLFFSTCPKSKDQNLNILKSFFENCRFGYIYWRNY